MKTKWKLNEINIQLKLKLIYINGQKFIQKMEVLKTQNTKICVLHFSLFPFSADQNKVSVPRCINTVKRKLSKL